jgi:DNA adenine methylase
MPSTFSAIQPIPYQGSKRKIADAILVYAQDTFDCLYEPFAGSAAISIAAKQRGIAKKYFISDVCSPLIDLWQEIVFSPTDTANRYEKIWNDQLENENHYNEVREAFNRDQDPVKFLYLIARCVKNAVRFNSNGKFNQSPDKRRKGRSPTAMRQQILAASNLFRGNTSFAYSDYEDVLMKATSSDLVYFDPPYLGVSNGRDRRYCEGLNLERFIENLYLLNKRGIPFLLSFDGSCGNKIYCDDLPNDLNLLKVDIHAGRSAQATLNGRDDVTIESLYVSRSLVKNPDASLRSLELAYSH